MKLVFDRSELNSAMLLLQDIAKTKSALPILANVHINVEDDVAVLTATDLQVSARLRVNAYVEETGSATLPAATLANFVRELPDKHVRIETLEGRQVDVSAGNETAKLPGISTNEFPRIDDVDSYDFTIVNAGGLQELISCTKFAVAAEETRYVLNAVYLQAFDGKLWSVATDSMRLAVKSVDVKWLDESTPSGAESGTAENDKKSRWSGLLPIKAADELLRIFDPVDQLRVGIQQREYSGASRIAFNSGVKTLISRLQDGNYVEYQELIPKENTIRMKANRRALMNAVQRVSLFSDRKTQRVSLSVKEDHLELSSISTKGRVKKTINAASTGPIDIDFKNTFLREALEAARSEEVYVDFKDRYSAAVVREADAGDYICVVMPLEK